MDFKKSLDRYLTTPPEDKFGDWVEQVVDKLSQQFFNDNEKWIEEDARLYRWLRDLFDKSECSPEDAAMLMERDHLKLKNKEL